MELTRVVLPTPGPPAITSTLEARATRTAPRWLSASASFVRCSTQGMALSASIVGHGSFSGRQRLELFGDLPLSPIEPGEEDATAAIEVVGDYVTAFDLETERRFDELGRHFEQCLSERDQLFGR